MNLRSPIYDLWRRWFGTYSIDDPRRVAEQAPYTYFLPTENELLALAPGDLAKLVFRSRPPGAQWDAERMWVKIVRADGARLVGELDNIPYDMPQLKPDVEVRFRRSDVIDLIWDTGRMPPPPPSPPRREFWERCFVDHCVLEGKAPVDYIYREEPDPTEPDDKYPDSGWRIRGTEEGIAEDERLGRGIEYVALGAVLNRDDRWISLIDAPMGSQFRLNPDTCSFEACVEE